MTMLLDRSFVRACASCALAAFAATALADSRADPGTERLQMRRTIIESPNGTFTQATDVNNSGVVIGIHNSPEVRAFAWTRSGGLVDLEGAAESEFSIPWAVNECGQIVGELNGHAALWNTFGEVEDLGTLGGDVSVARGINDRGDVVGFARVISGARGAPFLWTEEDGMREIGGCTGPSGIAAGINNKREVAGVCDEQTGTKAFFWSEATGRVDFPLPQYSVTSAIAINDRGEVTGNATKTGPTYNVTTFKWNPRTQRVVFQRGLGDYFDVADDINRFGWVAGAAVYAGEIRRATVWLTPRRPILIDPSLGTSSSAYGLNDLGGVVGTIDLGNRDFRAVLWEPPAKIARLLEKRGVGRCLRPG
jgi:uncharacterized membrane protein